VTDEPGRCLGIDLGDARIGLALSDPQGTMAQPLAVVDRHGERGAVDAVARAIDDEGVVTAVVGLPLLLSGAEGERARRARAFAGRLARRCPWVRVELWDERLTTVEAERAMVGAGVRRSARRRALDAVAAALILQSWLDARPERR
jgi:putative Holliday junction resolvase